jgi:hypothetical protein
VAKSIYVDFVSAVPRPNSVTLAAEVIVCVQCSIASATPFNSLIDSSSCTERRYSLVLVSRQQATLFNWPCLATARGLREHFVLVCVRLSRSGDELLSLW